MWASQIFQTQNTDLTLNLPRIKRLLSRPPMTTKFDVQRVNIMKLVLDSRIKQKHLSIIKFHLIQFDQILGYHATPKTTLTPNPL